MCPALWPGVNRTVKPATSSPSASSRSTGCPGPSMIFANTLLIAASFWRLGTSEGSSTAARSSACAHTGMPNSEATAWVAPM